MNHNSGVSAQPANSRNQVRKNADGGIRKSGGGRGIHQNLRSRDAPRQSPAGTNNRGKKNGHNCTQCSKGKCDRKGACDKCTRSWVKWNEEVRLPQLQQGRGEPQEKPAACVYFRENITIDPIEWLDGDRSRPDIFPQATVAAQPAPVKQAATSPRAEIPAEAEVPAEPDHVGQVHTQPNQQLLTNDTSPQSSQPYEGPPQLQPFPQAPQSSPDAGSATHVDHVRDVKVNSDYSIQQTVVTIENAVIDIGQAVTDRGNFDVARQETPQLAPQQAPQPIPATRWLSYESQRTLMVLLGAIEGLTPADVCGLIHQIEALGPDYGRSVFDSIWNDFVGAITHVTHQSVLARIQEGEIAQILGITPWFEEE